MLVFFGLTLKDFRYSTLLVDTRKAMKGLMKDMSFKENSRRDNIVLIEEIIVIWLSADVTMYFIFFSLQKYSAGNC